MVSLEQRQDLARLTATDVHLERFRKVLNGESFPRTAEDGHDAREAILAAISSRDSESFKRVGLEIEGRRISSESDWCHDDYLVFLLLLGNEKFGRPLKHLSTIIDARWGNKNPVPRKLNEVFAALNREEFGIDGEFGFLKLPFLALLGKLNLNVTDAKKALEAMSVSIGFDQLSPFLQILAIKAHDIVLTERKPVVTENAAQLIAGFESHAQNLSLRQWWQVLSSLPGHLILSLILVVGGLGLIPFLIGAGSAVTNHYWASPLVRPDTIPIMDVKAPGAELPPEASYLVKNLVLAPEPGKTALILEIDCAPFEGATPAFVVEISHATTTIQKAFAFLQDATTGPRPFTVVPVQEDSGRIRILIPSQLKGKRLCVVIALEASTKDTPDQVAKGLVVRPLD